MSANSSYRGQFVRGALAGLMFVAGCLSIGFALGYELGMHVG